MRVLIVNSGYHLNNMGDVAMLQIPVARLQQLWPDALIEVFADIPEKHTKFFPNTGYLLTAGHDIWFSPLLDSMHKLMSKFKSEQKWVDLEWKLRQYLPSLARYFLKLKLEKSSKSTTKIEEFEKFIEAVYNADLVVATGGGYITDVWEDWADKVLGILGLAIKLGKPTVMLGHGLGPIQSYRLLAKSKAILPSVNLITLREKKAGIPLLNSIGVPLNRVIVTGDDAIELAFNARKPELGNGIGINLRVAEYSGVGQDSLKIIRSILQGAARNKRVPLIPVSISHVEGDSDVRTIQQLLAGYDDTSDGGKNLDTPLKVIQQVGMCRIVVTGSYHAGVFALSQGIPVIGLAKSEYYVDKFLGLADQFGDGCEVVLLNDYQLEEKLLTTINNVWEASEQLRPKLLEAAKRQIELGHKAYKQVSELVQFG
jgi:colanic acid/amylovoran biosynthesis protein